MALACGTKAGSLFDNSEHGIVAVTKTTFAPFLAVAVRTLLPSPDASASASNRARPSGKSPHCAEPEQLDQLGADFPLGVPIPIGDHMKMRLHASLVPKPAERSFILGIESYIMHPTSRKEQTQRETCKSVGVEGRGDEIIILFSP